MDCTAIPEWRDTQRETTEGLSGEVTFKTVTLEPFIPGQQGSVTDPPVGKDLTKPKWHPVEEMDRGQERNLCSSKSKVGKLGKGWKAIKSIAKDQARYMVESVDSRHGRKEVVD